MDCNKYHMKLGFQPQRQLMASEKARLSLTMFPQIKIVITILSK